MIFLWPVGKLPSSRFRVNIHLQVGLWLRCTFSWSSQGSLSLSCGWRRLSSISVCALRILCLAWHVPLRRTSGAHSICGPILSNTYNPSSSVLRASSPQWSRHVPCLSSLHILCRGKCLGRETRDTRGSFWGPRFVPPRLVTFLDQVCFHTFTQFPNVCSKRVCAVPVVLTQIEAWGWFNTVMFRKM